MLERIERREEAWLETPAMSDHLDQDGGRKNGSGIRRNANDDEIMERDTEGRGGGPILIVAAVAMGLCCALPVLLASGALSAAAAGLFDGGLIYWLVAGVLALAAGGVFAWSRRNAAKSGRSRRAGTTVGLPHRGEEAEDRAAFPPDASAESSRSVRERV